MHNMKKLKFILVLLLALCLCACDFTKQQNSITDSNISDISNISNIENNTENKSENSIEFQNINCNLKFLCAWQSEYYIQQGYIDSHYFIYYITEDNHAYSALWKTDDKSPENAILSIDNFTNIEELGEISFAIDDLLLEISTQELVIQEESEQLDIDEINIWFYGYVSNKQFLFYQTGNITAKKIQTAEATELINQLYSESTFGDARFQWSNFYSHLGEENVT